jgi:hypothetical protein
VCIVWKSLLTTAQAESLTDVTTKSNPYEKKETLLHPGFESKMSGLNWASSEKPNIMSIEPIVFKRPKIIFTQ